MKSDDDEDVGTQGFRGGYKTRADGTKTTDFNNDLSEEEKKRIGSTVPKRIVEPSEVLPPATSALRI